MESAPTTSTDPSSAKHARRKRVARSIDGACHAQSERSTGRPRVRLQRAFPRRTDRTAPMQIDRSITDDEMSACPSRCVSDRSASPGAANRGECLGTPAACQCLFRPPTWRGLLPLQITSHPRACPLPIGHHWRTGPSACLLGPGSKRGRAPSTCRPGIGRGSLPSRGPYMVPPTRFAMITQRFQPDADPRIVPEVIAQRIGRPEARHARAFRCRTVGYRMWQSLALG